MFGRHQTPLMATPFRGLGPSFAHMHSSVATSQDKSIICCVAISVTLPDTPQECTACLPWRSLFLSAAHKAPPEMKPDLLALLCLLLCVSQGKLSSSICGSHQSLRQTSLVSSMSSFGYVQRHARGTLLCWRGPCPSYAQNPGSP